MHRSLLRIRHPPTLSSVSTDLRGQVSTTSVTYFPIRPYFLTAFLFPTAAPSSSTGRWYGSETTPHSETQTTSSNGTVTRTICHLKPVGETKDGGLEQAKSHRNATGYLCAEKPARSELLRPQGRNHTETVPGHDGNVLTERRRLGIFDNSTDEAAWDNFIDLCNRADFSLVIDHGAAPFRNSILRAALTDATRMKVLYDIAQHLRAELQFKWPELYFRVIAFYLGQNEYSNACLWHLRLMPTFTPSIHQYRALIARCALDPNKELQIVLERIYIFSPLRMVYDHLIPTLFENGQSQTARFWRKRLIKYGDYPTSSRSRAFLKFCTRYFPLLPLSDEELAIARLERDELPKTKHQTTSNYEPREPMGTYSDSFIARWFASSWASLEFAINLMHKLGLQTIGPRSLQSIALREESVEGVSNRLTELEELGIAIAPTTYCTALAVFAKGHQQDLLTELLFCDVHPDEFDDEETRRMLMDVAKRQKNEKRKRLLQEVEKIAFGQQEAEIKPRSPSTQDSIASPEALNELLDQALCRHVLGKARLILDRMESSNVHLSQVNARNMLVEVFRDLWYFPKKRQQKHHGKGRDPRLDRAILITRRVMQHDVAIPLKFWRILLFNLGRLGRFEEFEELSNEIIDSYTSIEPGLILVHPDDVPPDPKPNAANLQENEAIDGHDIDENEESNPWPEFSEQFWETEMGFRGPQQGTRNAVLQSNGQKETSAVPNVVNYIPSDLPFSNRQHPIAKLFDARLQRAIIRWTFDKKLASPPYTPTLLPVTIPRTAHFDIMCGVRFLATLRDRGLSIDRKVLRSALISRIAVAEVPGRPRHRSRDQRELSPVNLKRLVDEAWGQVLFPSLSSFIKQLEDQKPKVWNSYRMLMLKAYDPQGFQSAFKQRSKRKTLGRRRAKFDDDNDVWYTREQEQTKNDV